MIKERKKRFYPISIPRQECGRSTLTFLDHLKISARLGKPHGLVVGVTIMTRSFVRMIYGIAPPTSDLTFDDQENNKQENLDERF